MRRLLFAATLVLIVPGRAAAQYCVGVPTADGQYALESHYLRTPGLSGVGLTATADRAGPLSLRASLSRAASSTAVTGGAVWELPSLSWSGCPMASASYQSGYGRSSVVARAGFGMSARPADGSRLALFAVPQMIHVRFEGVDGEPDSNTEAAVEIGLRYAGDSFYGGVSTTPMTGGDYRWKSLDFTAGLRTGARRDDAATAMGAEVRDRFAFSAGAMWAGAGDNEVTQCGAGTGLSAGAELRTRGHWLTAVSLDLLANLAVGCTTALYMREYEGRRVAVDSHPAIFGPRLSLRAGRAFRAGGMMIEPALGVGLLRMHTDDDEGSFLSRWQGVTLAVRPPASNRALLLEYGWRQIPIRYYDDGTRATVHEFTETEPMLRMVLEF